MSPVASRLLLLVRPLLLLAVVASALVCFVRGPTETPRSMLSEVIEIARDAGDVVMRHYAEVAAGTLDVEHKADASPVTRADQEANALIVERLRALAPDIPAVAEESDLPPYEERATWRCFWLVDPLDGTKEFLKHNGEFTVNIALIDNGVPVLGVLHAPAFALTYYAEASQGSWKQEGDEPPQRIHSRLPPADLPLRVLMSRSHSEGTDLDVLLPGRRVETIVPTGSALKFGLLAEGRADVYVRTSGSMEWDVAAGDCIYRHSGREGVRETPFTYNKPSVVNAGFVLGLAP